MLRYRIGRSGLKLVEFWRVTGNFLIRLVSRVEYGSGGILIRS